MDDPAPAPAGAAAADPAAIRWIVLIYKVPTEPSRNRVSVWRELKRHGALFLQNCVCVLPDRPECRAGIVAAGARIRKAGGELFVFDAAPPAPAQSAEMVAQFQAMSAADYQEILEECETKFMAEIAFETGRQNYTYEEAEEIREDFEKIVRWNDRVVARDWFHSGLRDAVAGKIRACEAALEAFEEEVFRRTGTS